MFSRRVEVTRPVKAAAAAATASPTVVTLLVSQSAEGDEAVVVWDHDEPRIGKVVGALEQAMPDDVWVISP